MNAIDKNVINEVTKELVDKGKIIEAGWKSMRIMAIPRNASDVQLREMRKAFFAGAQHLFASILCILDPGSEATEKDMERMHLIDKELKEFVAILKEQMG